MSKKLFDLIIKGKGEMPVSMIMKFARVFKTDPFYWIEMQNRYFAHEAEKRAAEEEEELPTLDSVNRTPLHTDFLLPMNWTLGDFADHVVGSINNVFRHYVYIAHPISLFLICIQNFSQYFIIKSMDN